MLETDTSQRMRWTRRAKRSWLSFLLLFSLFLPENCVQGCYSGQGRDWAGFHGSIVNQRDALGTPSRRPKRIASSKAKQVGESFSEALREQQCGIQSSLNNQSRGLSKQTKIENFARKIGTLRVLIVLFSLLQILPRFFLATKQMGSSAFIELLRQQSDFLNSYRTSRPTPKIDVTESLSISF